MLSIASPSSRAACVSPSAWTIFCCLSWTAFSTSMAARWASCWAENKHFKRISKKRYNVTLLQYQTTVGRLLSAVFEAKIWTYMKYSKTSIIHTYIICGPQLYAVFEIKIYYAQVPRIIEVWLYIVIYFWT